MASEPTHAVDLSAAMISTPVAAADWLIIAPVAMPIIGGAALLMLRKRLELQAWLCNLVLAVNLLVCVGLLAHIHANGPQAMTMGRWLPPFGISFTVDPMGAVLALTGAIVAFACGLYSTADINSTRRRYGFYTFFLLMMAGVNGAFLTGDIFNLYVWFEVLLISSFGLIVLGGEPRQLDGAVKYAFLNLIATTLFLIATGYLYGTLGTLNMADITRIVSLTGATGPLTTIATLYFLAFAMKSAAFPLYFWLPASYHTPRIVVSALFAGLLTKVGVYSLLRVIAMLFSAQRDILSGVIELVAITTMFVGVFGAIAQSDLRRMLGYLVVSGIGVMLAGMAVSGPVALSGTLFYAVHSMLIMAALYLAVGVVGQKAGTFEMRELGGQYAASPLFAVVFLILAFAVAGLPPLSGFWPKVQLVRGAIGASGGWLTAAILVSAMLTSIAIMRVWLHVFWRGGPEGTRDGAESWKLAPLPSSAIFTLGASIGILAVLSIAIGLFPETLLVLTSEAAKGIVDPSAYIGSVFGVSQ